MIRTILLVEDDRGSALLVKTLLEKEYYKVLLAGNGVEALEVLSKNPVHLVITDVVMPIMDGVDLYDQIKKSPKFQHLPVIIITDKQMFKEAFSSLGVDHFISKTDDIQALLDKIKTINADLQKKDFFKVLISGSNHQVVEQMRKLLLAKNYLVTTAENSFDTLHKSFLMVPHLLLLDLRMSDQAKAKEIIQATRSFSYFYNMKILTYAYLKPDEMPNADAHWQIIQNDAAVCEEAGGAKFIGNFSQADFLQKIQEHIEKKPQASLV